MSNNPITREIYLLSPPESISAISYLYIFYCIFSMTSLLLTLFVISVSLLRHRDGLLVLNGVYVLFLLFILNLPRVADHRVILALAVCKYYLTLSFYLSFSLIYFSSIPKVAVKPENRKYSTLGNIIAKNSTFVSILFPSAIITIILGHFFLEPEKRPVISISHFLVYSLEKPGKPILFALILLPGIFTIYLMIVFLVNLIWRRERCKKHLDQSKITRLDIGKCIFNVVFFSLLLLSQLVQMLLDSEQSWIEISSSMFGLMYFSNFGFSKRFRQVAIQWIRVILPFVFTKKAKNASIPSKSFGFKSTPKSLHGQQV